MTDAQKALQIAEKHKVEYRVLLGNRPAIVPSDSECYGSAIEMAKWKNLQIEDAIAFFRSELQISNNVYEKKTGEKMWDIEREVEQLKINMGYEGNQN